MGLIGGLLGAAVDVVTLPVDIVKDVASMGGAATGERSATIKKLEEISEDLKKI